MKKYLAMIVVALALVGCDDSKEEASEENRALGKFACNAEWYAQAIAAEEAGTPWAGVTIPEQFRNLKTLPITQ